ncbi:MAG: zinc chelation protein SecC [Sulfuricurvum sp. GWF2_44_89]|uniref:Zinc chelation protein SecC n=1 Tax=Sulfuricurvum kujiense TaxID=148813 RepID=A0A2D3WQG6_9BACT|nr:MULTISPECIES: YchJ family metal-binding protein [Sulfuricurvum]OHD78943.1 MAG: zinc chelation protein SecC [Sulfuricurvum sp. GWF2_44_89]OHD92292.1 MAG: zinc chelation protein SecC [Sulfuricurvum sp. RIFOXYD2_FULL_44_160]OHD93265.1 MAG: zinc chelation protein SecC [Sulfuricurvum sp. RIFOXYD12_FULL_44_77]DAB39509.1 MAG TPA: zinc chelation protein SecC [Sulfuricurvum kujiense]
MKISSNALCPCHSGKKYKQCCQPYHRGILPSTAEKLMRSRYSAFALGLAEYIMATTHPNNSDYTEETERWRKSILNFSQTTRFLGLKIGEFSDGKEEAFVRFEAILDGGSLCEKSRFLNVEGKWLYESGTFI